MSFKHFKRQQQIKSSSLQQAKEVLDWNVLLAFQGNMLSIDGSENGTLNIEDEKQQIAVDRLEAQIDVQDALKQLTDIEVDVIRFRYGMTTGEPQSFLKIGEYFGFSATKANKIHDQAIHKLRQIFAQL